MSGSQETRLDRLVLLLETGSAAATRKAAAEQIGGIAKQSGSVAAQNALVYRLRLLLRSKSWDARVAAASAIEAVCRAMDPWDPEAVEGGDAPVKVEGGSAAAVGGVLSTFDVQAVISKGQLLVSSSGQEFNDVEMDPRERLALQKQQLRETLGLAPGKDSAKSMLPTHKGDIFNVEGMIMDDDLVSTQKAAAVKQEPGLKRKASDLVADMQGEEKGGDSSVAASEEGLSARERNQLRRKQRKRARDAQSAPPPPPAALSSGAASNKTAVSVTDQPQDDKGRVVVESVRVTEIPEAGDGEWPLEPFCDDMCHDMFDSMWEIRHGAAMAVRDCLKHHAAGAGRSSGTSQSQQEEDNACWLEGCAVRLLCVLALDRFGDYVSDQVVAPVRETAAQALGVVLRTLPAECLEHVVSSLTKLVQHEWWEVRHGGMLGFKYMIAVRPTAVTNSLGIVLPIVCAGIEDEDDDVRAVAAEALLPLVPTILHDAPEEGRRILTLLWGTLLQLDDLTASTPSVMNLIAEFFALTQSHETVHQGGGAEFAGYLKRLWPFFRHQAHPVRKSVVRIISSALSSSGGEWLPHVLPDVLHLVFINLMLEQRDDIVAASQQLWDTLLLQARDADIGVAVERHLWKWFGALGTPPGVTLDPKYLEGVDTAAVAAACRAKASVNKKKRGGKPQQEQPALTVVDEFASTVRMRVIGVHAIGILASKHVSGASLFHARVDDFLSSKFGTQVQVGAMVLAEWADAHARQAGDGAQSLQAARLQVSEALQTKLDAHLQTLDQPDLEYAESSNLTAKWRGELGVLLRTYALAGIQEAAKCCNVESVSVMDALQISVSKTVDWDQRSMQGDAEERSSAKRRVITTIGQLQDIQMGLHTSVLAAVASVAVTTKRIPPKVAPLIRALMEAVQRESQELLQERAAMHIVGLMQACTGRKVSPGVKILNNLCVYLCEDPTFTPRACDHKTPLEEVKMDALTWVPASDSAVLSSDDEIARSLRLKKRGAVFALSYAARTFGRNALENEMKSLWDKVCGTVNAVCTPQGCALQLSGGQEEDARAQELVDMLQVALTLLSSLQGDAGQRPLALIPLVVGATSSCYGAVRQMACRLIAELCAVVGVKAMEAVIRMVLPLLGDAENVGRRLGAAETLHRVVRRMDLQIIPFSIFLVVPILGRMSDSHVAIRQTVTQCFGTLLQLLPLEAGIPDPEGLSADLALEKQKERRFLEQLLDTSKIDNYAIPVQIDATLRKYQQEGVNWMAFLLKYHLHGILCDDMGLGKTLQTICIIASDHHDRKTEFERSGNPSCTPLPSLVVCPPTLVGHWAHEISTFCGNRLPCLQYVGPPAERKAMRNQVKDDIVLITSYDTVRNDVDFLSSFTWNYCVLDEGHVIKNPKSGTTKAVKCIRASHRLMLSGTPIQNNVLELWSLFDFLMPGFLGTEQHFNSVYSKPILASRNPKCTPAGAEAGALALEALHRQVLPFMLRRTKTQVLSDLPPKIIQDYHCDMSAVQIQLYNAFMNQQAEGLKDTITSAAKDKGGGASHIFQALQYLRKLTNHPKLVLDSSHALYSPITKELASSGRNLSDLSLAPKLLAVRQLLWDCGIGVDLEEGEETGESETGEGGTRHRVLIFAQMKVMLDIIEKDLFAVHMPSVSFLRMDGGTPNSKRFEMQQIFNGDPTIDVLLLTTHVGGLGLNLTGADTVIFVEHDWNPMRDLQAMDRAHRIGQKNVVNVYRLITRDTLEEKIMGLQKFKLNIANSVVNEDNASLKSMDTTQLLDLFTPLEPAKKETKAESDGSVADAPQAKGKLAEMLGSLEELWDEEQYNEEFNVEGFVKSLPGSSKQ